MTSFGINSPVTSRALNNAFAELEAMIVGGAAAAGSLTGTTLAANVVNSSLTSVGTITSGTWSGSFGAVSGANLTSLNASNLSSGTVPSARVSGSYTGITGVGTLSAGSIPVSLVTGLAASATTDTTNAGNISSGTLASARISGSYTGITAVGTLTSKLNVDGASSVNIGIGDWSGGASYSAMETSYGYLLLGSAGDQRVYLRTQANDVRIGTPASDTLIVSGTNASINKPLNAALEVSNFNVYISGTAGSFVQHSTNTGSGQAAQWSSAFGVQVLVRNTSTRADKENVQPLDGVITPGMIDDVDVLLWNRKTAPGVPEIGPMAEDMDNISPFLATHGMDVDENGDICRTPPNGISPNGWMSLLTIALQDCRRRISVLEGMS